CIAEVIRPNRRCDTKPEQRLPHLMPVYARPENMSTEQEIHCTSINTQSQVSPDADCSNVSAQFPAHSKYRRDRPVMVSTIDEVDTLDERCFELFET
ncbi:MAG TPA: hypothetical protein VN798_05825, partial [Pseudomonas sp.]|nr:hypothetical protein [Pseudomonas sp.]